MTGKEIITIWARECLGDRLMISLDMNAYAGILAEEWQNLIVRIDEEIRAARQDGLDHRKSKKMLSEESEYGFFWQKFYLRGGVNLPGLAEAFNCKPGESIWQDQWNEVIRVSSKKPTLRAVDPTDFLESLVNAMSKEDWSGLQKMINEIIADLAGATVDESKPVWSPAMRKGK